MRETRRVVCGFAAVSSLLLCGVTSSAQSATSLPEQDRALARDIFKQLIETNTQDSDGSVTAAAETIAARALSRRAGRSFCRLRLRFCSSQLVVSVAAFLASLVAIGLKANRDAMREKQRPRSG